MKVYYLHEISNSFFNNPAVTIGFFDGVHIGHVEILNTLKNIAAKQQGETVVVTLWPHPRQILYPNKKLVLLHLLNEKINALAQHTINHLIIIPFDINFAQLTAEEFTKAILIDKIGTKHLLAGHDNFVGHNREGSFEKLSQLALKYNFEISKHPAVYLNGTQTITFTNTLSDNNLSYTKINSTEIRTAIEEGNITKTNLMLGYNFTLTGIVAEGRKIGRTIGYPTANILINEKKLIPKVGVYAVWVSIMNINYKGMLNIGFRPTFNSDLKTKSIEVHLIDYNNNLYNTEISVSFVAKIRDEIKFENVNELIKRLDIDKLEVLNILNK